MPTSTRRRVPNDRSASSARRRRQVSAVNSISARIRDLQSRTIPSGDAAAIRACPPETDGTGDGRRRTSSRTSSTRPTTGKPKGVAVNQASICNFVRVAAEIYGYGPGDRVYQGMTIAFDFSVEELWVPMLAGGTLVPARPGASLVGDDLADFLLEQRITGMCCVPTLLRPSRRICRSCGYYFCGRSMPAALVTRWSSRAAGF